MKSDLNADFISQKAPHYKRERRRGASPEHDNAQHPYRIRRTGYGCVADKKCPTAPPLAAPGRRGFRAMGGRRDGGVFGPGGVGRGGGGGLWTDVSKGL